MQALMCGRYRADLARSPREMDAALALRAQVFRGGANDRDRFDEICDHIIVTDVSNSEVVATARVLIFDNGADIHMSYAAQTYDLSKLSMVPSPMLELGRFCVKPGQPDADVLRCMWGVLTRMVDGAGVRILFGCASFDGTDLCGKADALSVISRNHGAPAKLCPGVHAPETIALTELPRFERVGPKVLKQIPALLRSYLAMGAWISDHAVVDDDLGTLHVFTGLEIDAIPPARKRLLRALAGVDLEQKGA